MKANKSSKKWLKAALILLLIAFLYLFWAWFLRDHASLTSHTWEGVWETTYFYENDPALLYEGTLHLSFPDSLNGYLEVFPPQSTRKETLALEELSLSSKATVLSGYIVHGGYKINGGYLRESFEFRLDGPLAFGGEGACVAFCAEGTTGWKIVWEAKKEE